MERTKITKTMILEAIKANVGNMNFEGMDVQSEDVIAYADQTINQIKAASVARAEKKKDAVDELKQAILNVLTVDAFQSKEEVAQAVNVPEVAKVTARLSSLVKEGIVKKEQIKIGDRRVMGYALA